MFDTAMPGSTIRARLTRLRASGKALAFAIHLGLSLCAVGALAALMFVWWYPPPFFMVDGGWQVLRLIVLVDVVVGPLLTLIVFDRAKKELRRDLAIIVLLQAGAFAYGTGVMVAHRPAFIVYAEKTFYSVHWRDIRRATPDLALPESIAAGAPAPVPVVAQLPADRQERKRLFDTMAAGGPSITHHAALYRKLDAHNFDHIARDAVDIDELARGNPEIAAELLRVRIAHPRRKLVFVPLDCRYGLIMLVFDRDTMAIVDWMS